MRRNAKFLSVAVAGSLLLAAFSGCSSSGSASPTTSGSGTASNETVAPSSDESPMSPATTDKSITVQLIVGVKGSPFYEAMECGAKQAATDLGVNLKVAAGAEFAAAAQLPILNAAIAAKPNAIALVPTDPVALNTAAQEAIKAGIKLLTVDQVLGDNTGVVTEIISDNEAGGAQAADEMAREIGESGKVLVLTTEPGQVTSQDQRAKGFVDQLKKYPNITYVGPQYSNDDPAKTAAQVIAELSRNSDLSGIFATNDQSGIGAASGLASANAQGKVKLIAYDAATSQVQSLREGSVQALIAQDPHTEGIDAVKYAVAAVRGETVPPTINTDTQLLNSASSTDLLDKFEYKGNC